jgi:tetrahydromethanopterin S-methyltransferase subunit G
MAKNSNHQCTERENIDNLRISSATAAEKFTMLEKTVQGISSDVKEINNKLDAVMDKKADKNEVNSMFNDVYDKINSSNKSNNALYMKIGGTIIVILLGMVSSLIVFIFTKIGV